jgi:uncharacterized membrane protein
MRSHAISFGGAALGAAAVLVFAPAWLTWTDRSVAAFDVFALALLAWYWLVTLQRDAAGTGRRAAMEDPGRNVVFGIVLAAVIFAFIAALQILAKAPHDSNPAHTAFCYAIGLGAVVFGWFLIHTAFLFRYAHLYYGDRDGDDKSDGGLLFPGHLEPSDLDFAYFSFVLGMTFQVSDVQITGAPIRRLALVHGLLSFGYNAAIISLGVNVVSGILHP